METWMLKLVKMKTTNSDYTMLNRNGEHLTDYSLENGLDRLHHHE